ncbi:MAG TPA: prepilin-type N-terminal cleavage/methylation domain-containing protein, partial [Sphingomonas sp.]|nr:prepilin-type N-terminal cleavage/methylation domain-containing protein [Sphingomonas sp.]
MTRNARANGFTLIEMLVSLGVLGLLSMLLLGGVFQTGSFLQRQAGRTGAREDVVTAQQLLRDRLEQLRPVIVG